MAKFLKDKVHCWYDRPGPGAAEQLRVQLAQCRRDGLSFAQAWAFALSRVRFSSQNEQAHWLHVWHDSVVFMAWADSYERESSPSTRGLAQLAEMADTVAHHEAITVEPSLIEHHAGSPSDGAGPA
jgi:hypothetical protein